VQAVPVARYCSWTQILAILAIGIWIMVPGILVALIYAWTVGKWLPTRQSGELRYWLEGSTLRVAQGVYFLKRKAIPPDRVTDVMLVQGPLMRHCGIWSRNIQTAGMGGQSIAEAVLYGIEEPERVRDLPLASRDAAVERARA